MATKSKFIRIGAIGLGVIITYSIAMGLMGGCGKKAADPAAAAAAASPSPSVSPEASASPEPSASPSASPSPTAPVVLTSDTFVRANSTTTLGDTNILGGGTAQTWLISPTADVWGIISNLAYNVSKTAAASEALVDVGATAPNCTFKVKLAALPGSGNIAGLVFRTKTPLTPSDGNSVLFVYDGGLDVPDLGTAGYKIIKLTGGISPARLGTIFAATPAANDELMVELTTTQVKATVTPASGTAETQTVSTTDYNTKTFSGITASDSVARFSNFVIQDCQ
ncbi:hypothetical protein WDW86_20195 [Bdellovibrionota bacterium FG-2]